VNSPIAAHTTLSAVEGSALCHQPLMANPIAPNTFIH
jgi:hypothetical protein